MPTGYTSDLYDGKDVAFEDFVLHCARAFGAWVHQREESSHAKPKPRTMSDYVVNQLANAKQELKNWLKATDDDKYDMWRDYADATEKRNAESVRETTARNARFGAMMKKVNAYDPPEGLENLKTFMQEQLGHDTDRSPYQSPVLPFDEWVDNKDQGVRESVQYARKRYDEEMESVKKSNEFTADLYASLGLTYKE